MKPYDLLNQTFDRIFVVTLRRATDRQERTRERLRGLRYEFFWGTDKAEIDVRALERAGLYSEERARALHRNGKPMSLGHIGCSMSHRAIYEAIVRNGWQRVLVFEDDVLPRAADLPLLALALAELPDGWDTLYLGYDYGERFGAWDRVKQATYLPLAALRLIKWTPRQVMGLHSRPFSPHLRRAGKHHGTHAYAVSLRGATRLLEAQTPVASNADQLLIRLCIGGELEAFVTAPKFFDQESTLGSTGSYIVDEGEAERRPRLERLWPVARRGPLPGISREIPPVLRGPPQEPPRLAVEEGIRAAGRPLVAVRSAERDAGFAPMARAPAGLVGAGLLRRVGDGAPVGDDLGDVAEEPSGGLGVVARGTEGRVEPAAEEERTLVAGAPSLDVDEVARIALPGAGVPE